VLDTVVALYNGARLASPILDEGGSGMRRLKIALGVGAAMLALSAPPALAQEGPPNEARVLPTEAYGPGEAEQSPAITLTQGCAVNPFLAPPR
jgi:hypothetical protein